MLGGRDLQREIRGTWLGITRQGRIACLTNFREEAQGLIRGAKSRGSIVNAFLTTPPGSEETAEQFARRLIEEHGVTDVGGFSLLFGRLRASYEGLAIVSNRTPDVQSLKWLAGKPGETYGLSNSHYGDMSWPKVVRGEKLLDEAVKQSHAKSEDKDDFIERLLQLLSVDTLPKMQHGEEWEVYLRQLRHSIFIPAIGGSGVGDKAADEIAAARTNEPVAAMNGVYGTQKQSVILVDRDGRVTFVERTLFDRDANPVRRGDGDRRFDFEIDGWQEPL